MGTRMSARAPSTYVLLERGKGRTAASSTCAVAARNLGLATMVRSLTSAMQGAKSEALAFATLPYGGMTRIRFKGCVSPAPKPDPQRDCEITPNSVTVQPCPCCNAAADLRSYPI